MTIKSVRLLAGAAALTSILAGCSEYVDRRDTIALSGGNAVAADKLTMMVDPWPGYAGDRDIAFNGSKMQSAVQRYRTNSVYKPQGVGTTSSYQQQDSGGGPAASDPTASQPSPPKSP
jgi:hypothetical protein